MKKKFRCLECNYETTQWHGKCPGCHAWNSIQDEALVNKKKKQRWKKMGNPNVENSEKVLLESQIGLNKLFGGGLEKGSINLLSGAPGVGKSTLLLSIVKSICEENRKRPILYISSEETHEQVYKRVKRTSVDMENFYMFESRCWEEVKEAIKTLSPMLVIVDSVQMLASQEVESSLGSPNQIKYVTEGIIDACKKSGTIAFLVGHVTKSGNIAGPMHLEHMVDAVFYFEKSLEENYRELRAKKNRFGSVDDVIFFEMTNNGLEELFYPGNCYKNDDEKVGFLNSLYGDGNRILPLEIEALVIDNDNQNGVRLSKEVDHSKLMLTMAIIKKYLNTDFDFKDLYVKFRSMTKVDDRNIDLSIIATILSAHKNIKLPNNIAFIGEVNLCGEILPLPNEYKVLKKIEAMGFKEIYTNSSKESTEYSDSLKINRLKKVVELKNIIA